MSVPNMSPTPQRSRSALDHRGIDVAARLLLAGIWLERQLGNAPKVMATLPAASGMYGLAAKVSRVSVSTPRQFLGEQ